MSSTPEVDLPGISRRIEGRAREELRDAIREEYSHVAADPDAGFHFHTGRRLADLLGYPDALLARVPESSVASFAGTGNPFSAGELREGERVVDVGCGSAERAA
jgi:hypothetical protein